MIRLLFCCFIFLSVNNLFSQQPDTTYSNRYQDSLASEYQVPLLNYGFDADAESTVPEFSSILQSSRDIFTQFASFQFSPSGYTARGNEPGYTTVMMNGLRLRNPETGAPLWSVLSGLNEVIRNTESGAGNSNCRYLLTGIGGYTNIDARPTSAKKGTRFSGAAGSRSFRSRFSVTHATGSVANGWSLLFSASATQANRCYRPGTFYFGQAIFFAIEKMISPRQSLNITTFVSPVRQSRFAAEQEEVFSLNGSNYYNSLWGFQNGRARNSAVANSIKPMLMISHTLSRSISSKITTTGFCNFGRSTLSGLNWYNTADPRPDYYKYLPSYFYNSGDSAGGLEAWNLWQKDLNHRQINWDQLVAVNRANLYTLPGTTGTLPNTHESWARYIVEDRVEDLRHYGLNSTLQKRINRFFLSAGVFASTYNCRKYKVIKDLLGATFWLDYDSFAQGVGVDPNVKQNNIEEPDKRIYTGDKFGYDYSINIVSSEAWTQVEYSGKRFDSYIAGSFARYKITREGFMANGKFPESSKGKGAPCAFISMNLKTGLTLKISGRQFLSLNAGVFKRPPQAELVYISPNTRNDILTHLKNERIVSGDINYQLIANGFKLKLTCYAVFTENQITKRIYYSDEYNTNINLVMSGISKLKSGIELGMEKTFNDLHNFQAAAGFGRFIYVSRPTLEAWQDNNGQPLYSGRTSYLKNYRTGGAPQLASGISYRYNTFGKWSAGISVNYFDMIYVEPNPDKRTAEALYSFFENETDQYKQILDQQKLPAYYVVNFTAGKKMMLSKKRYVNLNLSINNLFNNKNIIASGREQLRWDAGNIDKFPNKYVYMPGLTFLLSMNVNL